MSRRRWIVLLHRSPEYVADLLHHHHHHHHTTTTTIPLPRSTSSDFTTLTPSVTTAPAAALPSLTLPYLTLPVLELLLLVPLPHG